jgi:multimeric flavodoxin WrbA
MNVITLQGSPRKEGNTAKVLSWVEEELVAMGNDVESIFLNTKNLNGCLGCGKCKETPDAVGCVQKDDIPKILRKMIDADLVIFASPLYFWGVTSQLKTVIDRTYSFYVDYHQPGHASLVKGQRQAMLVTGAGNYENNAEATFTAFGRLQGPHMSINAGELYIGSCSTPDKLGDSAKEKAVAFAHQIIA